jgi:hypothetical protein
MPLHVSLIQHALRHLCSLQRLRKRQRDMLLVTVVTNIDNSTLLLTLCANTVSTLQLVKVVTASSTYCRYTLL